MLTSTSQANPNIAFIKYWGNRDENLRIPANGSISMNLEGLVTQTCIEFNPGLKADALILNGEVTEGKALERMSTFLDAARRMAGKTIYARVETENNFPTGAGIASSAAAYAALALASAHALELGLDEKGLSRLARRGSGSACRSVPGGFVEWQAGTSDDDSFAFSIADPEHWPLVDLIAVVESGHKTTGSSEGHRLAWSSPLQKARVRGAGFRLAQCRAAILHRDIETLSQVMELDSNLMHAVMMTSQPPLFYWQPASLAVMNHVTAWRKSGLGVCYTLDAGPNVHCICELEGAPKIRKLLEQVAGVRQVLEARVGGAAHLAERCTLR